MTPSISETKPSTASLLQSLVVAVGTDEFVSEDGLRVGNSTILIALHALRIRSDRIVEIILKRFMFTTPEYLTLAF